MPNPESSNLYLTVYRASAGSGKTHQLASEYLKLLYSSPYAYRHILAVTFTNKATDEMKSRVILELFKLASNKPSGHLQTLICFYSKDEEWIREKAKSILLKILHDYSAFSISTIDKFFQQTMRAFTRELGLNGGYSVELDTSKVLKESVDSMLYELEKQEDTQLLEWLIRFSEEKIENGDTWNIRSDIQSLSQEIFKEEYKNYSDEVQSDIIDKTLLNDYKKQLENIIYKFRRTSQSIGERALNIISRYELDPTDFKGSSKSSFLAFRRWAEGEVKTPTKTFVSLLDDVETWYTKTTDNFIKDRILAAFNDGLNDVVRDIIDHYGNTLFYDTALEINRYFFTLGILGDVDRKIREYTSDNNVMLISDTTELLRKIIQDDETPFIYEKVGTRIDNYMIDEFQDTSGMQWNNFRPLIKNSIASGDKNLIVGDVKQSIYRWRNSDWNLLDEQLHIDFEQEGINYKTLVTNWRSSRNVILFNNTIFARGSKILQQLFNESIDENIKDDRIEILKSKIEQAYRSVSQILPEEKDIIDGSIEVKFLEETDDFDWRTISLNKLPETIESLQEQGYDLRDIAILVRTRREGVEVAEKLLTYKREHQNSKYKYDIISDEALYLANAQIIKLVIAMMKHLRNKSDLSLKVIAVYEYFRFSKQLTSDQALKNYFSVDADFPEDVSSILIRIQELPLYEMSEELFSLFSEVSAKEDNIYIQSFLDIVLDFSMRYNPDLDSFLQWWDESGVKKSIFTPDSQDAIRIMTIHKSKGLEFKVTIIPFCSWDIDNKQEKILWCKPVVEPFDQLHLVPVKYSSNLSSTIFRYEYYKEKLHTLIDNLNVLYVAFTRPKDQLIVFAPKPTKEKLTDIRNISGLLWYLMKNSSDILIKDDIIVDLADHFSTETDCLMLGENTYRSVKELNEERVQLNIETILNIPFENRLKLRLNNKYFFAPDGQREYGTLMHEIVSKINSTNDLDFVLDDYYLNGDISDEERIDIKSKLTTFIQNPLIEEWYSSKYKILNEVQILLPDGTFVRPDRVMINNDEAIVADYKFGTKEEKKYLKQVKEYMSYIQKIGYKNVSGFIFYVELDKIVEV